MRRILAIGSAVSLVLALACARQPGADTTPDSAAAATADPAAVRQAIEAANAKAADALNKGDVETWLTNYTPDAVVLPPNQPAWRGQESMRSGAQAMLSAVKISNAVVQVEDVAVSGDLAVETGVFTMTLTPKQGKAVNDKGKYVTVWQRQPDGSWKAIRDIFNSDLPPTG
ncbi:MAG TPA: SgcJ/EcaC family oxidoreductase [Gemmatimonadaceae bacterium]|nr:SgcJ/EcaC family oxidoreductase [Gemmatimonadaceae bacterium]